MRPYTPILPFEVLSQKLKRTPEAIVKLDANENPYGPSPKARAALANAAFPNIYPDPDNTFLREALVKFTGLPKERLFPGAGADELIDLVLRATITPGDVVINCPPSFGMYLFSSDVNAAHLNEVPRRTDFSLDVPAIEAAVRSHPTWLATDMVSVDYGVAYVNSEYTSDSKSARIGLTGGCDGIVCPADGSIGGNQLQRQQAFQLAIGPAVGGNFGDGWSWYARADVNYQSKQYMDELNLAWLPDRTLVNVRIEVSKGPVTASLWARNLFDEEYGANGFFVATPFGPSYTPLMGELRTYGLTVKYEL